MCFFESFPFRLPLPVPHPLPCTSPLPVPREEERPLVEAAFESRQAAMRELFEAEQREEQESSQQRHAADVVEMHRLAKMQEDKVG